MEPLSFTEMIAVKDELIVQRTLEQLILERLLSLMQSALGSTQYRDYT